MGEKQMRFKKTMTVLLVALFIVSLAATAVSAYENDYTNIGHGGSGGRGGSSYCCGDVGGHGGLDAGGGGGGASNSGGGGGGGGYVVNAGTGSQGNGGNGGFGGNGDNDCDKKQRLWQSYFLIQQQCYIYCNDLFFLLDSSILHFLSWIKIIFELNRNYGIGLNTHQIIII